MGFQACEVLTQGCYSLARRFLWLYVGYCEAMSSLPQQKATNENSKTLYRTKAYHYLIKPEQ